MAVNSTVRLRLDNVTQQVQSACTFAIRMLMEDTHSHSTPITPKRPDPIGGTLRTAVSKEMLSPTVGVIKWHAPYAEYQERGYTTGPIQHYSTPGTHAHFVEESVTQALTRLPQYLRLGGLV